MRRTLWVGAGVALGVSGTLWSRRRLDALARRVGRGARAAGAVRVVGGGASRLSRRLGAAVDAGRAEAARRRRELREELGVGR
jgi:hypothetical protein